MRRIYKTLTIKDQFVQQINELLGNSHNLNFLNLEKRTLFSSIILSNPGPGHKATTIPVQILWELRNYPFQAMRKMGNERP